MVAGRKREKPSDQYRRQVREIRKALRNEARRLLLVREVVWCIGQDPAALRVLVEALMPVLLPELGRMAREHVGAYEDL